MQMLTWLHKCEASLLCGKISLSQLPRETNTQHHHTTASHDIQRPPHPLCSCPCAETLQDVCAANWGYCRSVTSFPSSHTCWRSCICRAKWICLCNAQIVVLKQIMTNLILSSVELFLQYFTQFSILVCSHASQFIIQPNFKCKF